MEACLSIFGILIYIVVSFSIVFCTTRSFNLREDKSQNDRILFNGRLAAIQVRSKISCARHCSMTDRCKSLFYKSDTKQCVLHEFLGGYLKLHPSITTSSHGWKYYEQVEWPGVFSRSDGCISNGFEYDPVKDVCYIIQIIDFDFDLIKQHCADLNSELIKITSQEKQDWITSKLRTNTLDRTCIQGNNDNIKMKYQFDDGTPMTYFNWNTAGNQPDGNGDHYIYMKKSANYKWNDMIKFKSGTQCVIVCEK